MKPKLRQYVTTAEKAVRYLVLRIHRDGTVSLLAAWKMQPNGRDVAVDQGGYIGDQKQYVRLPASQLQPADYDGRHL